ncbi:MAG: PPOX class F420-dependent oxidoreductase [Chloroflexi bacterium]|nr:MAG: PPOX class F420-dependent oxidoreductase [Chloroflexota bacterium]
MDNFPESFSDLLKNECKAFAYLATTMPDGSPQVTPVWFDMEGEYIRFNSAVGRVKDKNIRNNPHVALAIADPDDPYRYLQIRGKVVEITQDGADEHIHALSQKYHGRNYDIPAGQERVMYKVQPESFFIKE